MTILKTDVHTKYFDIRWGDLDALLHMNNVRYFEYFQECRVDWLASLDIPMTDKTGPIVVNIECSYLKPLFYPSKIKIVSSIHSPGRSSFILIHNVYLRDELVSKASCKVVWFDYEKNCSTPFPDKIGALLTCKET